MEPAAAGDIADACKALESLGPFPAKIVEGLAARDGDAMRGAVGHLIDARRLAGLREVIERFRATLDYGVFARVQSARLHQAEEKFAAALADLEDLTTRFPARAAPHWWFNRVRCLEGLGRIDEAEAVAREGAARFPDNPAAAALIATLLARRARPREALAAWDEIFARFGEGVDLDAFLGRASALRALRRDGEAQSMLEAAARRFPADPRIARVAAELAEARDEWAKALILWRVLRGQDEAAAREARALLHLGRVEDAQALLEARVAESPQDASAWREVAYIAAQTGDDERRLAALAVLTGRLAARSRADVWMELARARHDARDFAGGEAALRELERRFPDSPFAARERLRLARWLDRGQDELTALAQESVAQFPGDAILRGHWVLALLAQGRLELAERFVEALEAEDAAGALVARARLETDRGGDARLRAYLEAHVGGRDSSYADATGLAHFLLQHRAPWGLKLADDLLSGLGARATGRIFATALAAEVKIRRRDDQAALAIIDAIPAAYRRPDVNELRAWAADRRGDIETAQAIWRENVARVYFGAIDCPIGTLERLSRDLPPPGSGLTAFVVFRNEAPQLPGFLAHHRKLGVKRFVCFDHISSDGSCALLLNQPDVVLYQSRDSYQLSSSGRRWIAEIVAREGAGGWGLQVDPDEYFIYPGWETAPLDKLLSYLEARGFAAMRAYMLDLFPPRLFDDAGEPTPLVAHRWYDDDYAWVGQVRPPYLTPIGGVRQRLFGATEVLHKTPLWRLDAGRILNSHESTPMALADVSGALLHFKLYNMTLRGREAAQDEGGMAYLEADTDIEVLRRHSRYAARLADLWRADLVDPAVSREIGDSLAMTARGTISASPDYLAWLRT